ncbi:hypothetical protein GCM10009863_30410 [Streptomyces axinellae]|uniref:Transposase n=1 Tax=Streptomyces axinellae TaxID=552788 RepID=A0ABN3Q3D2_9ACTN
MGPRRWDFISSNRAGFGVKRTCRVLGVRGSGCCRHLADAQARAGRQAEIKRTVAEVRAIFAGHQGAYGGPAGGPADAGRPHRRPTPAAQEAHPDRGQGGFRPCRTW